MEERGGTRCTPPLPPRQRGPILPRSSCLICLEGNRRAIDAQRLQLPSRQLKTCSECQGNWRRVAKMGSEERGGTRCTPPRSFALRVVSLTHDNGVGNFPKEMGSRAATLGEPFWPLSSKLNFCLEQKLSLRSEESEMGSPEMRSQGNEESQFCSGYPPRNWVS
jgi:hypothetical protein